MAMFSNTFIIWCKKAVSWLVFVDSMGGGDGGLGNCFLFKLIKRICYALLTCSMALGGASVGLILGSIKGQTTETGFIGGAGTGAMAGAISGVQLVDLIMGNGNPFFKVALLHRLMNEWGSPALLEAYQWQTSSLEASFSEISDIFDANGTKGLSKDIINMLPISRFSPTKTDTPCQVISCIICLEDFEKGEVTRMLPSCSHTYHKHCIDEWLSRHGSCPICRRDI